MKHLVDNIRKHEETFQHLLPEDKFIDTFDNSTMQRNRRKKRGLIDGIGKGMKWLFGTATDEDVQEMKAHLKFATSSYKKIKSYQQYLNSYLIKTNTRVDNAISMLNFNHDIIQHAINNISDYRKKSSYRMDSLERQTESLLQLTQFTSALVLRMSQLIDQLTLLESYGEKKLHGVQRLLENKLPLQLVTPFDLRKMMNGIEKTLAEKYGDYHISVDNVAQFYSQNSHISYAFDESFLAVYVKIPISNLKTKFTVYQTSVTSTPLMKNKTDNGQRSLRIFSISPYLAVAEDNSFYVELTPSEYQICISNPFKKCPGTVTLRPIDNPSCTQSVFFDNHANILQRCDIQYSISTIPQPMTYFLGNGSVLIRSSAQSDWTKICRKKNPVEERMAPCLFCIVDNSCCELQSEEFYVPLDIDSCKDKNYSTTVKHIQSVPFLSLFFMMNITNETSSDDHSMKHYGDLSVNMDHIDAQWQKALEADKRGKSDLEMLGWLISQSSMDASDEIIDQTFIFERYTNYFVVAFTLFGILLVIAYIILAVTIFKVRNIGRKQRKMLYHTYLESKLQSRQASMESKLAL